MVIHLASETCEETGAIFNTGMGYFNRAAVLTGPGAQLGDLDSLPTPEDVRDNWDAINALEGAQEIEDANAAIFALITPPADDAPADEDHDAGRLDIKTIFEKNMPASFQADAAEGVDVVFQFSISGSGGGEWSCAIKDKTCTINAGQHEKPVCTLKMEDQDFLAMMTGKLPAMQAYTSGKLQIEGDIMKSQLIERLFNM
jgi:putative sterol carrier protein